MRKLIGPGIILAVGVAYFILHRSEPVPEAVPVSAEEAVKPQAKSSPAAEPVKSAAVPERAVKSNEPKSVREITPSREEMARQVEADPHVTPEALLKFSVSLSEKQEQALKSEETAKSFLSEMESCALEQKGRYSIQALCLLNAKRMEKVYPSLSGDYRRLEQLTDPKVVTIMKGMAL